MKKYLLLLILPFLFSCTNYYSVVLVEDAPLFENQNDGASTIVIPKGETVYLTGGTKKYRKIKYGTYRGYVYNPVYSGSTEKSAYKTSSYRSSGSSSYSSSSKTVHVKGYTRKDGTYVKPHTRSAPRKH